MTAHLVASLPGIWAAAVLLVAAVWRPLRIRPLPIPAESVALAPGASRGLGIALALAAAVVDVRLGVAFALFGVGLPVLGRRRRHRELESAVRRELPEVVDLLALSLAGGGSISASITMVGRRPIGPVSSAMAEAAGLVHRGHRLTDAIERSTALLGDPVRPLVRALVGSEHYGTELAPVLARLATEARDARRRHAQADARRVPVRMLVPLVLCVLPAFVLLTVVPTLVGTFQGLDVGSPP